MYIACTHKCTLSLPMYVHILFVLPVCLFCFTLCSALPQNCCNQLYYLIGKTLSFHEASFIKTTDKPLIMTQLCPQEATENEKSLQWYKNGSELGSMPCSYEYWKAIHKCKVK